MAPELEQLSDLPYWAQVHLAVRMVRRVAMTAADTVRPRVLAACDSLDRCARHGEILGSERETLRRARDWQPTCDDHALSLGIQGAISAAHAAEGCLDCSAAGPACTRAAVSSLSSVAAACRLDADHAARLAGADCAMLRRLCIRARLSGCDPMTSTIFESLPPLRALPVAALLGSHA